MRVAVTGSHGLIGTALVERLRADGHDAGAGGPCDSGAGEIGWDPHAGRLDPQALAGIDAVVNLAGAGIGDKRWTDEYKREVLESRTRATTLLAEAMAGARAAGPACCCRVRRSASTATAATRSSTSARPPAPGSSPTSLGRGRRARRRPSAPARRVVHLRTGIVLAPKGGALGKLLPLFKVGLGGRFGSGRQWMSWIASTTRSARSSTC